MTGLRNLPTPLDSSSSYASMLKAENSLGRELLDLPFGLSSILMSSSSKLRASSESSSSSTLTYKISPWFALT